MNTAVVALDVISAVSFAAAALLVLFGRFESPLVSRAVRNVFAGAMGLYAFVGLSNVLEHAGFTTLLDTFEDFAEILFIPAIAYVATMMLQNQQVEAQLSSARQMSAQNDLLLNIVDTVPGGILVVGPTGAVTFANEGAERILGMRSDTGGSVRITPSWTLVDPATSETVVLAQIASQGPLNRRRLTAQWPDGTSTDLVFSSTPMSSQSGDLGGSVIAFEAAGVRG
ncbi:MAG: hypothetical protein HGB10_06630 [Coriobacteriia bacterium]|nr:hypothetical protein [Coriobacteriia bacterium]